MDKKKLLKIKRFISNDLKGWSKNDANYILYIEFVLMFLFLNMNAADQILQNASYSYYGDYGSYPISSYLLPVYENLEFSSIFIIERVSWWLHILGILFFLNYLYYSKHLHILLAFPNTYFSNIKSGGGLDNLDSVTKK